MIILLIVVMWMHDGTIRASAAPFSSMDTCIAGGPDVAAAAEANPKTDHTTWSCIHGPKIDKNNAPVEEEEESPHHHGA